MLTPASVLRVEEQAQIFERFHRASNGDQQPGSGIGLSLVAEMTAAQGGSVEVDSEPGVGSQFVVRLPRYNGSRRPCWPTAQPNQNQKVSLPRIGRRLLIIEDEPDLRGYLTRLFTKDGYAVEAAADAATALTLLESNPPDLLITDVMLPGQSGLDLLTTLRQDEGMAAVAGGRADRTCRRRNSDRRLSLPVPTTLWSSRSTLPNC